MLKVLLTGIVALAIVAAFAILWLVWLAGRKEARKEAREEVEVQAALVGQHLDNGTVKVAKIVQVDGPTATFDPPLIIQPGESVELHFTIPLEKRDKTVKN